LKQISDVILMVGCRCWPAWDVTLPFVEVSEAIQLLAAKAVTTIPSVLIVWRSGKHQLKAPGFFVAHLK